MTNPFSRKSLKSTWVRPLTPKKCPGVVVPKNRTTIPLTFSISLPTRPKLIRPPKIWPRPARRMDTKRKTTKIPSWPNCLTWTKMSKKCAKSNREDNGRCKPVSNNNNNNKTITRVKAARTIKARAVTTPRTMMTMDRWRPWTCLNNNKPNMSLTRPTFPTAAAIYRNNYRTRRRRPNCNSKKTKKCDRPSGKPTPTKPRRRKKALWNFCHPR
mmetsp:Transcript_20591/g.44563  ORF Transcript_20591/g.44563 Transcript_20591/m.44563 type:complete len:213 (+) Transcript_20591:999-1637(+)